MSSMERSRSLSAVCGYTPLASSKIPSHLAGCSVRSHLSDWRKNAGLPAAMRFAGAAADMQAALDFWAETTCICRRCIEAYSKHDVNELCSLRAQQECTDLPAHCCVADLVASILFSFLVTRDASCFKCECRQVLRL
jgi:hypothetical protein